MSIHLSKPHQGQNGGSFSATAAALKTGEAAAGGETAPAELEPAEVLFLAEACPGHQCSILLTTFRLS